MSTLDKAKRDAYVAGMEAAAATHASVEAQRERLYAAASTLDDLEAQAPPEDAELRKALVSTQRDLKRARAKIDDMVDAVYRAAHDAILIERAMPAIARPASDKRRKEGEVALWHLTDWQGGKLTASYTRDVMRQRVLEFTRRAERITNIQRADHPVRSCTVMFGGDMIEGLFQFPTQPFEIDATLFEQWAAVSGLIVDVTRIALGMYDSVTVKAKYGNHGRIGSRRDAVPRADNLDRMCYETARQRLADEKRLTWTDDDHPDDFQRIEIGAYRALLGHGDEIGRTGWVSPNTYRAYLERLRSGAYGWAFQDVYTGHRHMHEEYQLADGRGAWYLTGSTESDNRYARNGMGQRGLATQRLHFIEPEHGVVTSQHKIRLGW